LFTHNNGYSTMCGHGVIALGVVLPELGLVDLGDEDPTIELDTPAGRVTARPLDPSGEIRRVTFRNVPSYVVALDATTTIPGYCGVTYDLAFGGAYYAYCDVAELGITLETSSERDLIELGRSLKSMISEEVSLEHSTEDDLGFLYGVILSDEPQGDGDIRNVCVFADGEIDRSPTGTGVSGHLAIQHAREKITSGEEFVVESIVGSTFTGTITETVDFDGQHAVIPEITGDAYITGTNTVTIDPWTPSRKGS